jgi:hypothetical protein
MIRVNMLTVECVEDVCVREGLLDDVVVEGVIIIEIERLCIDVLPKGVKYVTGVCE